MGLPMNRHSKHRTRTRRAHHALTVVQVTTCAKCKTEVLPHRVCKVCGTYNGRQVLNVDKAVVKKLKKSTPAKKEA
jgi:large subunit ribosomal protein L32